MKKKSTCVLKREMSAMDKSTYKDNPNKDLQKFNQKILKIHIYYDIA